MSSVITLEEKSHKKSDESDLESSRRKHSQLEVPVIFLISTRFHLSCGVTMELMFVLSLKWRWAFWRGQVKFTQPNLVSVWWVLAGPLAGPGWEVQLLSLDQE